jgi:NAD(P)H-quinone oxidoreductase subunit 5
MEFPELYRWSAAAHADPAFSPLAATLLGLGLIAGPMGKCAQFPMHLWLDEAMEGPNPASILRNSVVVTCGALVLLKVMPLLVLSPLAIDVLLVVGTISAIGGALVAIAQIDLKRTFSYSTTAYLGLVFIAIALQQPFMALLLLFTHGLAKALLFMSLGCVISTTNCQDITELGGLARSMPATSAAYLVAGAGLTGLLPFGCFWAFGLLFDSFGHSAPFFSGVVLVTNGLTLFNLTRVYRQVFLDQPHPKTRRAPEVNWLMALPMVSLLVLVLLTPLIIQRLAALQPITHLSWWALLGLWASSLVGLLAGANVSLDRFSSRSLYPPLRRLQDLLANDFYTEKIYNATIVAFVARLAWLTNSVDRLVVNRLVNLVGSMALASAASLRLGVSGQLQSYVLTVVLAIVLLLGSLTWMRS